MINVPEQFRPHIRVDYPANNKSIFEEWYFNNHSNFETQREYLPIFWTSYYVNHDYGKDAGKTAELQSYIDSLDKSKKYFTIIQYDDGILNDVSSLDLLVLSGGSTKGDYPLPLLAQDHPYEFPEGTRDYKMNMVCSMNHPIRRQIANTIRNCYMPGQVEIYEFCRILSKSVFTLCPRGYGVTSFRIKEALQYGSIPVYISDHFWAPHNMPFNAYGVIISENDIHRINEILDGLSPEEIKNKQAFGREVYRDFFTYEANAKIIQSFL